MNTDNTKQLSAPPPAHVTLFLCGDVMTGRGIDQVMPYAAEPKLYEPYVQDARDYVQLAERKNGPFPKPISYTYLWGDALEVWQREAPDLKIINLETSITNHNIPWPGKEVQYRMHPGNAPVLSTAGINFCTLANNHTLDWGREGLLDTLKSLDKENILYAGAGRSIKQAAAPAILHTENGRIGILAFGSETSGIPAVWAAGQELPGINLLPDLSDATVRLVHEQVKSIEQQVDIVVFSVHWGSNWGYDVPPRHRSFAHQLVDVAGVDLVHGHSSHHPMGIEVYKDKLILYGAGDFITDYEGIAGHEQYRGDLTLMYFPKIDRASGKLISLKMVPMQVRNFRLNFANTADKEWLYQTLKEQSGKLGTSMYLNEDGSFALDW